MLVRGLQDQGAGLQGLPACLATWSAITRTAALVCRHARDVRAGDWVQVVASPSAAPERSQVVDVWVSEDAGAYNPYVRVGGLRRRSSV